MDHKRDYLAHQSRVAGVRYCDDNKWILSCGKDKSVYYTSILDTGVCRKDSPCLYCCEDKIIINFEHL